MLSNSDIIVINSTVRQDKIIKCACQKFLFRRSIEHYPIDSSCLKIFFAHGLSEEYQISLQSADVLFMYIRFI